LAKKARRLGMTIVLVVGVATAVVLLELNLSSGEKKIRYERGSRRGFSRRPEESASGHLRGMETPPHLGEDPA
jgi:hypothetical protein